MVDATIVRGSAEDAPNAQSSNATSVSKIILTCWEYALLMSFDLKILKIIFQTPNN